VAALRPEVGRRGDALALGRRMLASAAPLGCELFEAPRPVAWLSGSVLHGDLTPGSASGGESAFFVALLAHAVGWPFARGGAGRLTDVPADARRRR
jgi:phytoene dehydrogenase-like protein